MRQLERLLPALVTHLQGSQPQLGAAAAHETTNGFAPAAVAEGSNGKHVEDHRFDHARRFRAMSDQGHILVRIMGDAQHCRWVNRAWRDFTGMTTKELLGDGWLGHMHPDDREPYAEACREALESGRFYRMEYRLQHNDDEYGWVLEIGSPRLDSRGRFGGFVGVATECRERERA